jgi:ubiquinone/menaquinone biosynthesis C-methylase UbiE
MIELISEAKIRSYDYLRIRTEFRYMWDQLFFNSDRIESTVARRLVRYSPLVRWTLETRLGNLGFVRTIFGVPTISKGILKSTLLAMTRAWEYPWAILNSGIEPNARVLDVGSGYSLLPSYLAQRCQDVSSLDTDETTMTIIAPALADILKAKVKYCVGTALNLPAKDNAYDFVFCISVLEHLEQEMQGGIWINKNISKLDRTAIREFLRVVKPKGKVVLTLDYGSKKVSPVSFEFDYVRDLIEEFRSHLAKPPASLDDIRFTKEKEKEVERLWSEFYPPQTIPQGGALGIILTK